MKIIRVIVIGLISFIASVNILPGFFPEGAEGVGILLSFPLSLVLLVTIIHFYDKIEDHLEKKIEKQKEEKAQIDADYTRKRQREIRRKQKEKRKKQKEEKDKKGIEKITNKFGSEFAKEIYLGKAHKGMTKKMVREIDKINGLLPTYTLEEDKIEKWYYNKISSFFLGFDQIISFEDNKVLDINEPEDGIWIDMSKDVLIKACGQPDDIKKSVGRDKVKEKWYYGARKTRQGTTVYRWEVRLVNNIIDGWTELE